MVYINKQKLNSRILRIKETICKRFPELSQHIEKSYAAIPYAKCPDTTIRNLIEYYESLELLLKNYKSQYEAAPRAETKETAEIWLIVNHKLNYPVSANI